VILPAAILPLALFAADSIPLPPRVIAVKWAHGRAVALAATAAAPEWLLWEAEGRLLRHLPVGSPLGEARAFEVLDFTLDAEGTLHSVIYADLPLGRSARFHCSYPAAGAPRCADLGEVRCHLLAAASPAELWCFGAGPGGMALHRISGPREGPRFWVPAETVGLELPAPPGPGWLAAPAPDRAWLYVARQMRLYRVNLRNGEMRAAPLPFPPGRHALVSFAAHGERLVALFPLVPADSLERLDAPYGLHEWTTRGWLRRLAGRSWMRGAALAGMDAEAAWIWNRAARRLDRAPLGGSQSQ
jgi:hypothetical protein